MAVLITPMTELEAVNAILRNAGITPVNSLTDDVLDLENAAATLRQISVDLQAEGWWFNTECLFPLTPDGDNRLAVPANTLKADVDGPDRLHKDYVLRGSVFYDRKNHTSIITEPTTVTLVRALAFDELPSTARRYVTLAASRQFQAQEIGDPYAEQSDDNEEAKALRQLNREDIQATDLNVFRDNATNLATLSRTTLIRR
jgi:NACalpha-BTF3-like transcription factor